MSSYFGWMDYSEKERREALDVISLFQETDTQDELGIGTIRDAFADMLFPGISTVQRRARYFLFIPWVYLDLERARVSSNLAAQWARNKEVALIEGLLKSDDQEGILGKEARAKLKRLPSNIYWQGLGRWGIRLFPGSQDQYHRSLDRYYLTSDRRERSEDGEPISRQQSNWHPSLPPKPVGFPDKASFHLTRQEADYLQDRIMARAAGTFLAFMVGRDRISERVDFPWQYPEADLLPPRVKEQVHHARCFSETIRGAALLYNLLLARARNSAELVGSYEDEIVRWGRSIQNQPEIRQWKRPRFWEVVRSENARVQLPTQIFVDSWLDRIFRLLEADRSLDSIVGDRDAFELIRHRERALKGPQARLFSQRALELWNGAAGTGQLNYRWPVAQTVVKDILTGLRGGEANA